MCDQWIIILLTLIGLGTVGDLLGSACLWIYKKHKYGVRVIGTCKKCRYYEVAVPGDDTTRNWCHQILLQTDLDTSEGESVIPSKDFGCIHWRAA